MVNGGGFSAAEKLGVLKVFRSQEEQYSVLTNEGLRKVNKHNVDPLLKRMNNEQLTEFLSSDHGKISAFQNSIMAILT